MTTIKLWDRDWGGGNCVESDDKTLGMSQLQGHADHIQHIWSADKRAVTVYADPNPNSCRYTLIGEFPTLWRLIAYYFGNNGISRVEVDAGDTYVQSECVKVFHSSDPWLYQYVPEGVWYGETGYGSKENTVDKFCFFKSGYMQRIVVPHGMEIIITATTGTQTFGEGAHSLWDYGLANHVTHVEVRKVGWKAVKTDYGTIYDKTMEQIYSAQDSVTNPTTEDQDGINDTFTYQYTKGTEVSFEVGSEVSLTEAITVGGEASPVESTTEVSISTSISVGKSSSEETTRSVSKGYALKASPGKKTTATFIVSKVSGKIPVTVTLENAHGNQREIHGTMVAAFNVSAEVVYSEESLQ